MAVFISWLPFIGSMIILAIGIIMGKSKNSADISASLAVAYGKLKELYDDRITALESELVLLRPLPSQVQFLRAGIDVLLKQMQRMSIVPEWTPESGISITTTTTPKNGK